MKMFRLRFFDRALTRTSKKFCRVEKTSALTFFFEKQTQFYVVQAGPCNFVISDRETRTQSGLINHLTFRGWKVAVEYFSLISLCFGDTFYQLSMMNLSRLFKLRWSLQHSLVEHSSSNIMQCMGAWVRGDMKFLCKCLTRDHTSESSEIFNIELNTRRKIHASCIILFSL